MSLALVATAAALVLAGSSSPSYAGPSDRRLTVVIHGGEGSVAVQPLGVACTESCSQTVGADATVTLTAVAADGFVFSRWDGDCEGTSATCTLGVGGAEKNVVAIFRRPGSVMLEIWPAGRGTVALSTPGRDRTGAFVSTCSAERGDLRACSLAFPAGTTLTLSAVAAPGSAFQGWSDDECPGAGNCTLQLEADVASITAFFAQPLLSVRLERAGGGAGTGYVESDDGRIKCGEEVSQPALLSAGEHTDCIADYPAGAVVTLTASAETSLQWGFGCDSVHAVDRDEYEDELPNADAVSRCVVTVANRPVTVGVAFGSAAPPSDVYVRLKVTKRGAGTGTVRGGRIECGGRCFASHAFGTRLTLRADSDEGSQFDRWRGACAADAVCALQVGAVTGVQAVFVPKTDPPIITTTVTTTTTETRTVTTTVTRPGERRVLTVALESVRATGRGRRRRVVVHAHVNQPALAEITLVRGRRRAAGTRPLRTGSSRAFLLVPRGWPRGPARVSVVVRGVEFGSSPRYVRRVVLPR